MSRPRPVDSLPAPLISREDASSVRLLVASAQQGIAADLLSSSDGHDRPLEVAALEVPLLGAERADRDERASMLENTNEDAEPTVAADRCSECCVGQHACTGTGAEAHSAGSGSGTTARCNQRDTLGPLVPLDVQVVVNRYQGDKRVSSLPYTLAVNANDRTISSIRMGARVPVSRGATAPAVSRRSSTRALARTSTVSPARWTTAGSR